MPSPDQHAVKIADAAVSAWWKAHGGGRDEIPLGVVAALALITQANPAGPDPARPILGADRDEIAALLRHIWALFAITRPELSIRVGPFATWLDNPTSTQLDGARATAQAVVKAGQLTVTGNRELVCKVDLLGHVYQELRNPKAKRHTGRSTLPRPLPGSWPPRFWLMRSRGRASATPSRAQAGCCGPLPSNCASRPPIPTRCTGMPQTSIRSWSPGSPSTCTCGISARTWSSDAPTY